MSTPADLPVVVSDQPDESRYVARVGPESAGYAAYRRHLGTVVFTHTVVEPAFEGHGVGSALARYALDDARGRGLEIVVTCPFITAWIRKHADYADLAQGDS
jgi:predicted GNAT family acetyltransferase